MKKTLATLAAMGAIGLVPLLGHATVAQAGTPHQCFDDSRLPHDWTHGDPTVGVPSSPTGDNGYYYLNVIACSTTIEGRIWTSNGRWRIDIDDGYDHDHPLVSQWGTSPFSITATVHIGQFIRVRFANGSGTVKPDHASAYSSDSCALIGNPSDTTEVAADTPCNAEGSAQAIPVGGGGGPASPQVDGDEGCSHQTTSTDHQEGDAEEDSGQATSPQVDAEKGCTHQAASADQQEDDRT
jgi:hypothetical protein